MLASPWLYNGINELWCVFIKLQVIFYVINFPVEILTLLIYDLGSFDQSMKVSSFHGTGVVRTGRK
jgi:hypothetical protein